MLSSITPLGERGRSGRWPVTAAAYVAGSTAAAAALGALLGTLGGAVARAAGEALPGAGVPPAAGVLAGLAALAVVGVALDTGAGGLRTPGPARQVDEDWLARYRGWVYGAGFGAQLGLGVVTIVTTSTVLLTWAAAALSASPAAGATVGAVFGLARAVPVLLLRRVTTPDALRAALAAVDRARDRAHAGALAALGLVAVAGATGAAAAFDAASLAAGGAR